MFGRLPSLRSDNHSRTQLCSESHLIGGTVSGLHYKFNIGSLPDHFLFSEVGWQHETSFLAMTLTNSNRIFSKSNTDMAISHMQCL